MHFELIIGRYVDHTKLTENNKEIEISETNTQH